MVNSSLGTVPSEEFTMFTMFTCLPRKDGGDSKRLAVSSVLSCCTCRYAHGCQVLLVCAERAADLDVFKKNVEPRFYLTDSHRR